MKIWQPEEGWNFFWTLKAYIVFGINTINRETWSINQEMASRYYKTYLQQLQDLVHHGKFQPKRHG